MCCTVVLGVLWFVILWVGVGFAAIYCLWWVGFRGCFVGAGLVFVVLVCGGLVD